MGRVSEKVSCSKTDRRRLWELSRDASQPRIALRANLVLQCVDGKRIKDIAAEYSERPNTVILWRDRFIQSGIEGLLNKPRGKNVNQYGTDLKERILRLVTTDPPPGNKRWTGLLLSKEMGIPPDVIWRCLRKAGIQLADVNGEQEEITIVIPIELKARKESNMSSNTKKMDLEIVARITGEDGTVIEKIIKMDRALPNVADFDIDTLDGFRKDLDVYEQAMLIARDRLTEGITDEYLKEANKKNKKSSN
jgi:transposase